MLEKILETKREEIKRITLPEPVEVQKYSLKEALTANENEVQVIAEVKKASPSKGVIRKTFDPEEIALQYEKGGAAALSVLTDEEYFQGNRTYIPIIKQKVALPVLRKEFIIDSIQLYESVRIGADAVLLIAAALETSKLHELYEEAYELGLEAIVEFHSEEELEEVLAQFKPLILGINNRNLHTFETTLATTKKLSSYVPKESVFVSESGIYTYEDIQYVKEWKAKAVLVGESLMRQDNVEKALRTLRGENVNETTVR